MDKMKQVKWFVLLILMILIVTVHVSHQMAMAKDIDVIMEKDIVYGNGGDVELTLDLARPKKARGRLPTLIFIHGGAWGWWPGFSKSQYNKEIGDAAKRGYVAVTISYRLTNDRESGKVKYVFPDQIHDVKCAVRWLRANAKKHKIDPNHIGVVGWDSGGHLALMLGLTDPSDRLEGECSNMEYSSRVQAVVSSAGFTDLKSLYLEKSNSHQYVLDFLEGTPAEMPKRYIASSPLTYVSGDDPPVLLIQGDNDVFVPLSQGELLGKRMNEVGASHVLITMKGARHDGLAFFFGNSPVWDFFDEHLKGK